MFQYKIDSDSETPIYRQLVDQINAQIRSGALPNGTQLPTVRELADRLHLSCGTVKHVYDSLQKMGDIEMTRRRGTFVKYVCENQDSRKQQAMNAIDRMIRTLSELNFSPAEIQIFLNLKMREWGLKWSGVRIAVVTECADVMDMFEKQIQQIANVQVSVCTQRQLREYPYNIDEQSDMIIVAANDVQTLALLLPDSSKLVRAAARAEQRSAAALARLSAERIGIVCDDLCFANLVKRYLSDRQQKKAIVLQTECGDFASVDALVLPEGYESTCSEEKQKQIAAYRARKPVVAFAYGLDEGSMIYIQERIGKLRDERQLCPNALRF